MVPQHRHALLAYDRHLYCAFNVNGQATRTYVAHKGAKLRDSIQQVWHDATAFSLHQLAAARKADLLYATASCLARPHGANGLQDSQQLPTERMIKRIRR